jgi:integrase
MTLDRRAKREHSVLAGSSNFCQAQGLGAAPLVPQVVAAYLALGLDGRASSTKGTYHSVLRHLGGIGTPKSAPRFSGSLAPPPYNAAERAALYSIASAQRRRWRVHSALALLALGLGAGLRAGELIAVKGRDVSILGKVVYLRVGGARTRDVVVGAPEAHLVLRLATEPDAYLFHPEEAERSYPNFVNDFCRQLAADPCAPRLSAARSRSSYICDHLVAGTDLSVLLERCGIKDVESLIRYSVHVPAAPHTKAALRHQLAAERP